MPFDLGVRTLSSIGMPLPLENSLEASILDLLIRVPSGNRHIQKVRDRTWRVQTVDEYKKRHRLLVEPRLAHSHLHPFQELHPSSSSFHPSSGKDEDEG
jgi:hypothetical protein